VNLPHADRAQSERDDGNQGHPPSLQESAAG
jgi:hypothetical protein